MPLKLYLFSPHTLQMKLLRTNKEQSTCPEEATLEADIAKMAMDTWNSSLVAKQPMSLLHTQCCTGWIATESKLGNLNMEMMNNMKKGHYDKKDHLLLIGEYPLCKGPDTKQTQLKRQSRWNTHNV